MVPPGGETLTEGTVVTTFSGGKTADTATITPETGVDATTQITIPRNVTVTDFSFNVTGEASGGSYPYIPRIDVGADGDTEWAFDGDGYGALGNQFTLTDNTSRKSVTFNSPGSNTDTKFYVPEGAKIESARMQLAGRFKFNSVSEMLIDNYLYRAEGLAMGDIDGDGEMDTAATSYYGNAVYWYHNDGAALTWTEYTVDTNFRYPARIAVTDIDNDGHADLVVAGGYWTYTDVAWYRNSGTNPPTFTRYDLDNTLYYTWGLAVGDMNDDGRTDIITCSYSSGNVQWYENPVTPTTPASWTKRNIDTTVTQARSVDVGDADGDGDLDVLVCRYSSSGSVDWFENKNGLGTSWSKVAVATGSYFVDCNFSDIDSDGDLDAVATQYIGMRVDWFSNDNGDGSAWTTYNIAQNLNRPWGLHVGDIGNDGYKDVVVTGYFNNWVYWWEAPDKPTTQVWVKNTIDTNLYYAWDCLVGDVNGNGYPDILATAYLGNNFVWYQPSLSFPSDVSMDVGNDGDIEWSHAGLFEDAEYTGSFKNELQQHVNSITPGAADRYGVRMVEVPVKLSMPTSTGRIGIYELDVKYNWTTTVAGDRMVDELNELIPDEGSGDMDINIKVEAITAGKIRMTDLHVEFNERPKLLGPPSGVLNVPEDDTVDHLLDLATLFRDDYMDSKDLAYAVVSVDYPSEDEGANYVTASVVDGHWLRVSAERTPNTHWFGPVDMVIEATDDGGQGDILLTTATDTFRVNVNPVNDEPEVGTSFLEPVSFYETETSTEIDLDSADYFFDVDGDKLSYGFVVDPMGTYIGESVSVLIDEFTHMVTIGSVDGFTTGPANPVTVRFTADDNKGTTVNDAFQDIYVTIMDVVGFSPLPVWYPLDDLIMDEDTVRYNWIDLDEKAYDPDAEPGDTLRFSVLRIDNGPGMKVGIDSENQLDIEPAPDWNGKTQVLLSASDGIGSTSKSFNITVKPVNDQPTVSITDPLDGSKVKGRVKVTGVAADLEGLEDILIAVSGDDYSLEFTNDNVHGLQVWEYEIDGREFSGVYTVTVHAFDGEETASDSITLLFSRQPGEADDDQDDDGVYDVDDAFPFDPSESVDSDGDGWGDNADEFPADPLEWRDTDMDGKGDNSDMYPLDPTDGEGGLPPPTDEVVEEAKEADYSTEATYMLVMAISLLLLGVLMFTQKWASNKRVQGRIDRRRKELEDASRKRAETRSVGEEGDSEE
jgi:hypothetical protein